MDMTIGGINSLDAPKDKRRAAVSLALERQLAEVIFGDPTLRGEGTSCDLN